MTHSKRRPTALILTLAFTGILACHDSATGPQPVTDDGEMSFVLEPALLALEVGQAGFFDVFLKGHAPEFEALLLELEWTSSEPGIAEIREGGAVRALAEGEAIITAIAPDGTRAKAMVKVLSAEDPGEERDKGREPHY